MFHSQIFTLFHSQIFTLFHSQIFTLLLFISQNNASKIRQTNLYQSLYQYTYLWCWKNNNGWWLDLVGHEGIIINNQNKNCGWTFLLNIIMSVDQIHLIKSDCYSNNYLIYDSLRFPWKIKLNASHKYLQNSEFPSSVPW